MPSMSIAMSLRGQLVSSTKFSPLSLFSGGAVGVWFDPNDITTLFQDTAGTIPVTATGQSVALMLDKSGNAKHATQATLAQRPTYGVIPYGGVRNILIATDTLSTQSVTVAAIAQTLSFIGTGTIALSGVFTGSLVGTGASNQVSLTFTPTAGSLTLTVTGSVTFAQLEKGSSVTAYQKVTTKYNVTEVGKNSVGVLFADGVDDCMTTASLSFTTTDKVTVWSSVQKMGDAAVGIIFELGVYSGAGTFGLSAPGFTAATYRFGSAGTSFASAETTGIYVAPHVAILTGVGNISGDISSISVNNTTPITLTSDQGTGNYGNFPIYLFRRSATSLPFNGIFAGLVIRGSVSTPQQIYDGNTYLNNILGAY